MWLDLLGWLECSSVIISNDINFFNLIDKIEFIWFVWNFMWLFVIYDKRFWMMLVVSLCYEINFVWYILFFVNFFEILILVGVWVMLFLKEILFREK